MRVRETAQIFKKEASMGCVRKTLHTKVKQAGMCKMLVKLLGRYYCPQLTIKLRRTGVQP